MSNYRIVAQRDMSGELLLCDTSNNLLTAKGYIYDSRRNTTSRLASFQSILKQGYWKDYIGQQITIPPPEDGKIERIEDSEIDDSRYKYNEDQPRDEHGRFSSGSAEGPATTVERPAVSSANQPTAFDHTTATGKDAVEQINTIVAGFPDGEQRLSAVTSAETALKDALGKAAAYKIQVYNTMMHGGGLPSEEEKQAYATNMTALMQQALSNERDLKTAQTNMDQITQAVREQVVFQSQAGEHVPNVASESVTDGKAQAELQTGITTVGRMLDPELMSRLDQVKVVQAAANGRGSYQARTIQFPVTAESGTFVHEFGHFLEDQIQTTRDSRRTFQTDRTGGERPVGLNTFDPGYDRMEKTRPDDFADPYAGKVYPSAQQSEIVSMGMQQLYENPVAFARRDPGYAAFTFDILHNRQYRSQKSDTVKYSPDQPMDEHGRFSSADTTGESE